ncbi:hypothetical protein OROMI_007436 [Orobanche minor]
MSETVESSNQGKITLVPPKISTLPKTESALDCYVITSEEREKTHVFWDPPLSQPAHCPAPPTSAQPVQMQARQSRRLIQNQWMCSIGTPNCLEILR